MERLSLSLNNMTNCWFNFWALSLLVKTFFRSSTKKHFNFDFSFGYALRKIVGITASFVCFGNSNLHASKVARCLEYTLARKPFHAKSKPGNTRNSFEAINIALLLKTVELYFFKKILDRTNRLNSFFV